MRKKQKNYHLFWLKKNFTEIVSLIEHNKIQETCNELHLQEKVECSVEFFVDQFDCIYTCLHGCDLNVTLLDMLWLIMVHYQI
ncbi:hypothetical protein BpHYR1_051227 [Brachionus plicatilis]|uniref:Uncharacterized protein n=1 Tax=Brachionus plicatilis TaxID=10195 RepID=A0A3M7SXL4_BRAPC|nr:hypothetical protein BpHYR1_051227 [Brachionus plicatilis]